MNRLSRWRTDRGHILCLRARLHSARFPGGDGADVIDVNLSRDDLVTEGDHDWGDERESVLRSLAIRTRRWSAARSLVPESRF